MNERSLFVAALQKPTAAERAAFLDEACGGSSLLREQVESLIREHDSLGNFLESPAAGLVGTADDPVHERSGAVIGPYKLMEQIGEGGMGLVFVAEQQRPIRRKVALKVIKPGMDTRQIISRFEAERQVLALMNHPNIAKIFDAGETPSGRPFFVMELVKGVPITQYCDDNRLTPRARLELFVQVCNAVQHAHQKGIIHRDIKPTNVLVASHDGASVVKVIDFGIAKAMDQQLSDKSVYTNFTQLIGTPLYMSPEQAGQSSLDVDTRTDVYSLGVLLYELLTGTTPFDKERLKSSSEEEVRRIIREEEPPTPSKRLSTIGQAASTISGYRQSDPSKLSLLLRGELDWIVMKSLEKDRIRRYESASSLAADVQRYLKDEPVQACPPSRRYLVGKFLRRHRPIVLTVTFLLLSGMLLAAGGGWVALDRAQKKSETENAAAGDLREAEIWLTQKQWNKAQQALEHANARLAGSGLHLLQAEVENLRQDVIMADKLESIRLRQLDLAANQLLLQFNQGYLQATAKEFRLAFEERGLHVETANTVELAQTIRSSPIRNQLLRALDDWAFCQGHAADGSSAPLREIADLADDDQWRKKLRDPRVRQDREILESLADEDIAMAQPTENLLHLFFLLKDAKSLDSGMRLLKKAQEHNPSDFWVNLQLGIHLAFFHGPESGGDAVAYCRAALASQPQSAAAHLALSSALSAQGKFKDGEDAARKSLALKAENAQGFSVLGTRLWAQGRYPEAEAAYKKAIKLRNVATFHMNLGNTLAAQGRFKESIAAYDEAIALEPDLAQAHFSRGNTLNAFSGKVDEAIASFTRAITLRSDYAEAHCNLGHTLKQAGDLVGSLKSLKQGHELGTKTPNWKYPSANWVREAELMVLLDSKLPKYISGEIRPANAFECVVLARMCRLQYRQLYAASARFFEETFFIAPDSLATNRMPAAGAAALAGCGKGNDAVKLEPQESVRLRQQSLAWLGAALADQKKRLANATELQAFEARISIWALRINKDFDGVRDSAALSKLPDVERRAWQALWLELEELAKLAAEK